MAKVCKAKARTCEVGSPCGSTCVDERQARLSSVLCRLGDQSWRALQRTVRYIQKSVEGQLKASTVGSVIEALGCGKGERKGEWTHHCHHRGLP